MGVDKRYLSDLAEQRLVNYWPISLTWIAGIEVTQSIQYHRAAQHLTDPADRGADNPSGSLPTSPRGSVCTPGASTERP